MTPTGCPSNRVRYTCRLLQDVAQQRLEVLVLFDGARHERLRGAAGEEERELELYIGRVCRGLADAGDVRLGALRGRASRHLPGGASSRRAGTSACLHLT